MVAGLLSVSVKVVRTLRSCHCMVLRCRVFQEELDEVALVLVHGSQSVWRPAPRSLCNWRMVELMLRSERAKLCGRVDDWLVRR
jgi:hypothetical protein